MVHSRVSHQLTSRLPKLSFFSGRPKLLLSDDLPKGWRQLAIVALAALVATIGIDGHSLAGQTHNPINEAPLLARAANQAEAQLPKVQTLDLPPLPVKKIEGAQPAFQASHVVLLDPASQYIIYEKGGDDSIAIASTTKIVSALVALEHYHDLTNRIVISSTAINQIGSAVGFHPGETATIDQLLHGMLMVSGNDAAKALSEQLTAAGGEASTTAFVAQMNELAGRLGMNKSHFADPAGLSNAGYSSASDMTKAMAELLSRPILIKIIGTADYQYRSAEGYLHEFKNSNRLIMPEMYYPGMIGGKTGYTPKDTDGGAGHCIIVAASRDGHTLIAAVYDTYSSKPSASAEVARAVLDYGFNHFSWQALSR